MAKAGNKQALRTKLLAGLAVLGLGQAVLQAGVLQPLWSKNYSPAKAGKSGSLVDRSLSPDQMLFALAGFRELIAGILWVRADSFFDTGNYDAILPIIRLVTFLDPKQVDVFSTGIWHIAYNFTDEEQRSDRRYIPPAVALAKQGCEGNPETYEIFFETGWLWYHKIDDEYDQAVKYMEEAYKRPDIQPARKNLRSVVLQRAGKVDEGLENYYRLLDDAQKVFEKNQDVFQARQNRDAIVGNLDTMIVRMVQRGYMAGKEGRPLNAYDVFPPFDTGFSVKVSVLQPRVVRFEGTWNVLPVGSRIRCIIKDADWDVFSKYPAQMNWEFSDDVNLEPPRDKTFMQEQLFVRNRRFDKTVDMSRDPTMYPFKSKRYLVEFYYNPRSAPPHIQDKFSWNGEGLADKNFTNTEVRPGTRVFYTYLELDKDQLLRKGEWQESTPVVKTKNYVEVERTYIKDDQILQIPSLRSGG